MPSSDGKPACTAKPQVRERNQSCFTFLNKHVTAIPGRPTTTHALRAYPPIKSLGTCCFVQHTRVDSAVVSCWLLGFEAIGQGLREETVPQSFSTGFGRPHWPSYSCPLPVSCNLSVHALAFVLCLYNADAGLALFAFETRTSIDQ